MILDGCQQRLWLHCLPYRKKKTENNWFMNHPLDSVSNEQKSEQELNEFSIMHLSGEIHKGEKHTKEHESRRATGEEEAAEKSVKQQQHNIIITHITSRSEKSHSFSTRNAL
jgi:hypothetical protein